MNKVNAWSRREIAETHGATGSDGAAAGSDGVASGINLVGGSGMAKAGIVFHQRKKG